MIRFDNVSFRYGRGPTILNRFSLQIPENARICLSAPSGKGKTTLLRLLLGLEKPTSGTLTGLEGQTLSAVFQDDRLIPWKTVLENVALFSSEAQAQSLLKQLGLEDKIRSLPAELSGGMNRRVCLARALCHPSALLILDEAFTGLDDATKKICLAVTDVCAKDRTLIMATHDLSEAAALRAQIITFDTQ